VSCAVLFDTATNSQAISAITPSRTSSSAPRASSTSSMSVDDPRRRNTSLAGRPVSETLLAVSIRTDVSDVCNSRYNDKEWLSIRIKNWASCIPEELRQSEYMSIVPFERQVEPPLVRSPFLRGVKGPGFLAEPRRQILAEDDEEYEDQQRRRGGPPDPRSAPSRPPRPSMPHTPQGPMPMSTPYMPPGTPGSAPSGAYGAVPMPGQAVYRPAYLPNGGGGAPLPPLPVGPPGVRTIVTTMGGPQTVDQVALREVLPTETGARGYSLKDRPWGTVLTSLAALFERDARGQVLWFSGPPLPQGTIPTPKRPAHSLEYLAYLSKRKMGEDTDVRSAKRLVRRGATGEVEVNSEPEWEESEDVDLGQVWWAEGQSAEQIAAGLKAVIRAL
jgi:chromatin structure-remodeling complex subunit RSC1/2